MACDAQIEFRVVCWSSATARDLQQIGGATPHDLTVFERQVRSEDWQLWDIIFLDERLGCLIWSVEQEGEAHSLVINAAAAKSVRGVDLTTAIFRAFQSIAEETGARTIRCWTEREGMRRKLQKIGCKSRYVMEFSCG